MIDKGDHSMPDRRKLHEGAQMATNTKHRERRSMAEAPASAGDNGADAAPATPYNHSPAQPHQLSHLYTYVYVCYYLPREKITTLARLLRVCSPGNTLYLLTVTLTVRFLYLARSCVLSYAWKTRRLIRNRVLCRRV